MPFSWLETLGVATLIAVSGLAPQWVPQAIGPFAWFPAGVAFAAVVVRGRATFPAVGLGLLGATLVAEGHWLTAAGTAALGVALGYMCRRIFLRATQGKLVTPVIAIGVIVLGLVLFALPIALSQIGFHALAASEQQVERDLSPRVRLNVDGMAMSRDLMSLTSLSVEQTDTELISRSAVHTIISAKLGVLLLLPAVWAWPGSGLTRKMRRGFARALVANAMGYTLLLWLVSLRVVWPFKLDLLVAPICAGILAVATLVAAAFRAQRLSAMRTEAKPETRDGVTALPNHAALAADLALAIAHARREQEQIAVLFISIDGCERAHATLGYEAVDALLRVAADRVSKALTHRCSLYHLRADAFVVVAEAAGQIQPPAQLARDILDALRRPCLVEGHELALGCWIGASTFPSDAHSAPELIRFAQIACAAAKEDGLSPYVAFSQEIGKRASRRVQLEEDVRGALERDKLFVMYQPRASVRSGRPIGLEALLCATQSDGSSIVGGDLLAVAKRCVLVEAMSERLIHAVCAQLSAWRARGEQLFPVALMVVSEQLRQPQRLLESIAKALHDHNVPAELLVIEVSDFNLAHDSLPALAALRELDALGVRIFASGFGAARGALTQLVRLPLRGVALDEALLTNSHEPRARAVLRSLIDMGHMLQCNVVGKGVAIAEQLDTLRELGADCYQGELFSPPLRADEVDAFLMGQSHMAFVAHVGQVGATR